jgi:hypothetical protein
VVCAAAAGAVAGPRPMRLSLRWRLPPQTKPITTVKMLVVMTVARRRLCTRLAVPALLLLPFRLRLWPQRPPRRRQLLAVLLLLLPQRPLRRAVARLWAVEG